MEGKFKKSTNIIGVIIIIVILVVSIVLLTMQGGKGKDTNNLLNKLSLDGDFSLSTTDGKYQDKVCGISFNYPKNWLKSDIKLPLPQMPLSQVTFNEPIKGSLPPKNSILSFICYNAKKYSFDQFIGQNPLSQGQTEVLNVGSTRWKRVGNFIYTTRGDKLLIFEMFFTKYDLKPEAGYEETFLNILKSVQFF